ncbi:plasminogen-like [Ruditapes philippinarum]|uniref:plasminogen-like n=1 Tax=Ruditapes philippinarum TaxID=129788 RepID=UPI00295B3AB3|nr:plasminogen-like [Ruditapes philippinarum]
MVQLSLISLIMYDCCSGLNCFRRGYAWLYEGHTNVTKDNVPCQRWNACYPHRNSYIDPDKYPDASLDEAGNFCRSPSKSATPWCYTTGSTRWQYCNIDPLSNTQGGYECQNWDSQYPHTHKYGNMPMKFPENDVSKAKNYCRSPSWDKKPWCYTTDPKKRWDWCCINSCSDL